MGERGRGESGNQGRAMREVVVAMRRGLLVMLVAALACEGGGARGSVQDGGDARDSAVGEGQPAAVGPRKLDLILVIDNSGAMREEQDVFKEALPVFFRTLAEPAGVLPDMHVGILSSSLGAGPTAVGSTCPVGGDRGAFLVKADCGLAPEAGSFLRIGGGDSNVAGGPEEVATAVACHGALGVAGCGYEHQLASLALAVGGAMAPESNRGFLRDDAALAIIILSNEDDCSGSPDADFYEGAVPGQAASLRCSLRGHVCGGNPVPAMSFSAPLSTCGPYERNDATEAKSRLINVSSVVAAVKAAKKGRAESVFVGSIMGWDDTPSGAYRIVNSGGDIDTGAICSMVRTGEAAPGIRLNAFATAFPQHLVRSVCAASYGGWLVEMARKINALKP